MIPRTNQLLNVSGLSAAAAANGTPLQVPLGASDDRMYVAVQAQITGTLTVVIEGRQTPLSPWATLYTFTVSDAQLVARLPQMRARYSGASAGAAALVELDVFCKAAA